MDDALHSELSSKNKWRENSLNITVASVQAQAFACGKAGKSYK
jgi:hypothetical protein